MSALKLAHNLVGSSIRLRVARGGFHRSLHTTQRRTLEELSSGNKPSQDHGRYATWEMFFDQNKRYTDRSLGLEKDAAKSHNAVRAVGASLDELRRKADKGLESWETRSKDWAKR
ncbi:unnamed protein product [Tuber melanosporum]|uniref:(Perigord truffle) hypothetical protein n=1 Tax=Tuber melanosporum (strain Mel28) TaxID=656061 RepID=D5GL19_TUBMM|nr:uncharacterized protein GSTUM_00009917001 [Tuber melanosporum]CAZ85212.1 unnamed protein product [Tuber melanosporum]